MRLTELDERFVPRLAARLRTLLDEAAGRRRHVRQQLRGVAGTLLEPAPGSALRRLDDRYAATGPLALVRDVPQVGLLAVLAVFLAGAGVALARSDPAPPAAQRSEQGVEVDEPTSLGPVVGQPVDAYVASARQRAVLLSRSAPDEVHIALVSFAQYLTPEQARLALGDLEVTRVVLHPKLPTADVIPLAVKDLVLDVRKTYTSLAGRKTQDATEFRKLAGSIEPMSKEEEQFKAFYLAAAVQSETEARAYRGNCACVIAALVRGPARVLAALPAVPRVRAVEIGGRKNDDTIELRPLAPEQTGIVTKIVTPTDGNGA